MLNEILQYYGLDWAALILGLTGWYLITRKNRSGFLFSMMGCCCGLGVASMSGQYGYIVYNFILLFIMAHGFSEWRQKEEGSAALGAE